MPFVPAVTSSAHQPPSGPASRAFVAIVLLILLAPAAFLLPRQVDAVAWLAGAGRADTFTGYSYGKSCGSTSCTTVTDGVLASTGQEVTWPGQVPLGKPVALRDPVWNLNGRLDETVPDAIVGVGLGLFFDAIALAVLAVFAVRARGRISQR
ncbi:MAG: hypothetical protein ACRDOI_31045 [Trebonia sp.]